MSNDETAEKLREHLVNYPEIIIMSITPVNHKPHPFTIGHRHVVFAADNHMGRLTETAMEAAEKAGIYCAHPSCRLARSKHTYDTVCFLQFNKDITNERFVEAIKSIPEELVKEFDGFTLVEGDGTILD